MPFRMRLVDFVDSVMMSEDPMWQRLNEGGKIVRRREHDDAFENDHRLSSSEFPFRWFRRTSHAAAITNNGPTGPEPPPETGIGKSRLCCVRGTGVEIVCGVGTATGAATDVSLAMVTGCGPRSAAALSRIESSRTRTSSCAFRSR